MLVFIAKAKGDKWEEVASILEEKGFRIVLKREEWEIGRGEEAVVGEARFRVKDRDGETFGLLLRLSIHEDNSVLGNVEIKGMGLVLGCEEHPKDLIGFMEREVVSAKEWRDFIEKYLQSDLLRKDMEEEEEHAGWVPSVLLCGAFRRKVLQQELRKVKKA